MSVVKRVVSIVLWSLWWMMAVSIFIGIMWGSDFYTKVWMGGFFVGWLCVGGVCYMRRHKRASGFAVGWTIAAAFLLPICVSDMIENGITSDPEGSSLLVLVTFLLIFMIAFAIRWNGKSKRKTDTDLQMAKQMEEQGSAPLYTAHVKHEAGLQGMAGEPVTLTVFPQTVIVATEREQIDIPIRRLLCAECCGEIGVHQDNAWRASLADMDADYRPAENVAMEYKIIISWTEEEGEQKTLILTSDTPLEEAAQVIKERAPWKNESEREMIDRLIRVSEMP